MDILLPLLTIFISPIITASLVYFFSIKGKRKETDFQKEKELNVVLSNLLVVWNYLTKIETVIDIVENDYPNSIVPKKYFPLVFLKTGFLNDKCFQELDTSIEVLKKYDPILFFKLEGIGNSFDTVRNKFIMPYLKNSNTPSQLVHSAGDLLGQTLSDLEDYLVITAGKINATTLAEVRTYIDTHLNSDTQEIIDNLNEVYYEAIMQIIPDTESKPTLDEFIEYAKTEEYRAILEMQFDLVANDSLEDYLDIIANNPEISIEEVQKVIEKRQRFKK